MRNNAETGHARAMQTQGRDVEDIGPAQFKRAIESEHGGTTTFVQSVAVSQAFNEVVWEGAVHVFDLAGHPLASRAYAWSSPAEDGKRRIVSALRIYPINTPMEAVRAALAGEARKK